MKSDVAAVEAEAVALVAGKPPALGGVFMFMSLAGMLAWLIFSFMHYELENARQLRDADILWIPVALGMFQLLLRPENEKPFFVKATAAMVGLVLVACIVRQSVNVSLVREGEALLITLAVLLSCVRAMGHLSGRQVRVADMVMFVAMQWLLVFAAADLVLTWQNPRGIPLASRVRLAEMSLYGVGVHVAMATALARLPGVLGVKMQERAGLVALVAYNLGLLPLLFGWPWVAAPLMLAGMVFFVIAAVPLWKGADRLVPLMVLAGCVFVAAAATMRPMDAMADLGYWRHAVSAGGLGLAAVMAAAVSARVGVPASFVPHGLVRAALWCYAIGVAAHIAVEVYELDNHTEAHKAVVIGTALEAVGFLMAAVAGLRSHLLRARIHRQGA